MAEAVERVVEMSRGKTEAKLSESLHRVARRTTDHRPKPPFARSSNTLPFLHWPMRSSNFDAAIRVAAINP